MSGVVLRCTVKVLNLLGARSKDLATVEQDEEDWYANLIWLERQKCLLLAHAGTLFSVFVAGVHKADLMPIGASVVALIHNELRAENLTMDRFDVLEPRSVELAKTASRTVLGYMNDMARFCEYAIADSGGLARCDVQELNRELRRQLHLSHQPPGYFVPIELAQRRSTRGTAVERRHQFRIVD
jgi:hypothetical protein